MYRLSLRLAPGRSPRPALVVHASRALSGASQRVDHPGIPGIPGREEMLKKMRETDEFDVLVIGGGATGAGVALDAATRGLKVVCVEREDFGSGTSSRSTKLLWAGIRYLAGAFATLFQKEMLTNPRKTLRGFYDTFKMVMGCQRERNWLLSTAPHLTNWVPLAVPIDRWFIWPPPMKCPPAAFGPMGVYWVFFKFYDLLARFSCPPSHIMGKKQMLRLFPQLDERIKYACVFYEGQHDDARTNLSIALTAAEHGAVIANHAEVTKLLKNSEISDGSPGEGVPDNSRDSAVITGAEIRCRISGESLRVRAKSVVMCGGPFTDWLREKEANDTKITPVVNGAAGSHIVLPGYLCPSDTGMVDMATSDGRILFYLPWEGHTLVGTTDVKCSITDRPIPTEEEIKWIIDETNNYLSPQCQVTRKDVLSAWSGIRPLAGDPHAAPGAPASRDHVVSVNPTTKVVFVAGGKWTTYREMAEDAIDRLLETHPSLSTTAGPCKTLSVDLLGAEGYDRNLAVSLAKKHGLSIEVGARLARCYGGRAVDVCHVFEEIPQYKGPIVDGYPYLLAEIPYACREQARTIEDILSRRTRLSYLNLDAAYRAIPVVAEVMADTLGWSASETSRQIKEAESFLETFAGPEPAAALKAGN